MARPISYLLTDSTGAPLTTAAPSWVVYASRTGAARTPPAAPAHIGGGRYVFTPTDADEATGVCYLLDNGATASERRVAGSVPDNGDFHVWHLEDADGGLWAGAAPTVGAYTDFSGGARPTTPTPAAAAGAYLWSLTPSAADLVAGVSARIDSPAGAWPLYLAADFSNRFAAPTPAGSQVDPMGVFVSALRDYLTAQLPAAVAVVNARRAAVLLSVPGPFVVPVATPALSIRLDVSREGAGTRVTLPTGTPTATAVAAAITAAAPPGITATADASGRLVLAATALPTAAAPSVLQLLRDDDGAGTVTGGNAALGWAEGGEHTLRGPLSAPTWRGVVDGLPLSVPDMEQGFWLLLGDRSARPVGESSQRRDLWTVTVRAHLLKPEMGMDAHRSREGVNAAVSAVTEALLSTAGRQIGRASVNDVLRVEVMEQSIAEAPLGFKDTNYLFDVASLTITGRVFQRPANSG